MSKLRITETEDYINFSGCVDDVIAALSKLKLLAKPLPKKPDPRYKYEVFGGEGLGVEVKVEILREMKEDIQRQINHFTWYTGRHK